MDNHLIPLHACLDSFSYGNVSDRAQYDDALAAITDDRKKADFMKKHEDRNRSSMNALVKRVWAYRDAMMKKYAEKYPSTQIPA